MQIKIGARGVRRFLVEHEPGVDRITVEAERIDWDTALAPPKTAVRSGPIFSEEMRKEVGGIMDIWFGEKKKP